MIIEVKLRLYRLLTIVGFLLVFIIDLLTKYSDVFQKLLFNPLFFMLIALLILFPLVMLILWARTKRSRDVWRSMIAIIPTALVVYIVEYSAPNFDLWSGSATRCPALAQSLIYGTQLIGVIIVIVSFYRLIRIRSKMLALIYYLAIIVLLIPITYYFDIYQASRKIIIFQSGYNFFSDIAYAEFIFFLPWLIYELLNFFTITQREKAEELDIALERINREVHSTLDFDQVMERVISEAARVLRAESTALAIREEDHWSGRYQMGFLKAASQRLTDAEIQNVELGFKLSKAEAINDATKDPRVNKDIIDKYHFKSIMAIPLEARGNFIGMLSFSYHTHKVVFTDDQIDFANRLQTTVSLALQNARLYGVEKVTGALNDSLNKISTSLSKTKNINKIMNIAIKESAKAIGCETAAIALREDKYWVLRYNYGFDKKYLGTRFAEDQVKEMLYVEQTKEPLVANDALNDERFKQGLVKELKVRSVAILPLIHADEVIGVLIYNYHKNATPFTQIQIDFLKKIAVCLSLTLENVNLYSNQRNIAVTLQKAALEMPESVPGVDFSHLYHSATRTAEVGGDFYDLFIIEHNRLGILIGDVSGKGLEAATLTSLVKNTIKAYATEDDSPAVVIKKTNNILTKESSLKTFVTLFFGTLNIDTGKLTYCSAGHPPAILRKSATDVAVFSTKSPLVGVTKALDYYDEEIILKPEDILLLYTDGVIEARKNSSLFGQSRLIKLTRETKSIFDLPQSILDKVIEFSENNLTDDLAILALSLKPKG